MPAWRVAAIAVASVVAVSASQQTGAPRGTGAISGRVVDAVTGAPVVGAVVYLGQTRGADAGALRRERMESGPDGAFGFRSLPAGEFAIHATAPDYLDGALGKRRPAGHSSWLKLADGEHFGRATIELPRAATVTGVVTDEHNEPVADVQVDAWRQTRQDDDFERVSFGETDAEGRYRLGQIRPGDYVIALRVWHTTLRERARNGPPSACGPPPPPPPSSAATPIVTTPRTEQTAKQPARPEGALYSLLPRGIAELPPDEGGRPRAYRTLFYPNMTDISRATIIPIGLGSTHAGIDFQLMPSRSTVVRGRVVPRRGASIGNATRIYLLPPLAPDELSDASAIVEGDRFTLVDVAPGRYRLEVHERVALSCDAEHIPSDSVVTRLDIDVPETGVDELVVPLAEGLSLRGTIADQGASPRPESVDVWLAPPPDWGFSAFAGDWFTLGGLTAGRYAVLVTENGPEARWFVQSVIAAGRDLAGAPLTIGHDVIQRVAVVMRDRASPLEGTVVGADGALVEDATVAVFPIDRRLWPGALSGLMGFSTRRAIGGRFAFAHVVPGDYFVTAIDERRMDEWPSEAMLKALVSIAAPVTIGPAKAQRLTLQLRPMR